MQNKTKKIIAREILILLSVFILALLFILGNLIYNKIQNKRIAEYINQQLSINNSIYSLQKQADLLLERNIVYRFFKLNNLTEKDEFSFLNTCKNIDGAKLIYGFFRVNNLTDLQEDSFIKNYLLPASIDSCLIIKKDISFKNRQLNAIISKRVSIQNGIKGDSQIRYEMIWLVAILLFIIYILRPLLLVVIWSYRILRSR